MKKRRTNSSILVGLEIFLGVALLLAVFSYSAMAAGIGNSDSSSTSEWLMFGRTLNHTRYYPGSVDVTNFTKLWNFSLGPTISIYYSSPTVANGIVYVGGDGNQLFAVNATTGVEVWNYTTGNDVDSGPAVSDGIVYFGGWDNNVYALNATNGSKIWNYTTGNTVDSSPTIVNGIVYIGSGDKNAYALNATNGSKIWNYTTGGLISHSSAAIVNGIVYVGSSDNDVYALNATNGSKIWNYTTGGTVYSSPTIVNGIVYIGSGDKNAYALNATNGSKIWNYTTGSGISASPAVANGVVYIGSGDNNVYALNATNGSKIWNYTTGDLLESAPAVTDDLVFIGSEDSNVYVLNATNGSKIWNYSTGLGYSIDSAPAIVNGIVYIGSSNSNLYAFTTDTTAPNVTINSPTNTTYTTSSISFNVTAADNIVVDSCWYSTDSGTTNTTLNVLGNFYSGSATLSNAAYTSLFWCNDSLGNLNNTKNVSFTVSYTAPTSPGGGGSGGGISVSSWWNKTISVSEEQFELGHSGKIMTRTRFLVQIGGKGHHVGIRNVYSQRVIVEISSTPINVTFNVGDEKKFELTDDSYYDLSVKLNAIENGFANLTIKKINELISEEDQNNGANGSGDGANNNSSKLNLSKWWWGIIIIVVIAVLIMFKDKLKKIKLPLLSQRRRL